MHANWLHKKRGMVRSDKHTFKMDIRGERVVFSGSRRKGGAFFKSTITNKDFHEENFGSGLLKLLNNTLVGSTVSKSAEGQ